MPSRRDVLSAVAGAGLLTAGSGRVAAGSSAATAGSFAAHAGAADRSSPTPEARAGPWPMYRGDAGNTGAFPDATAPAARPSVVWERDVGGVPSAPAPVGGALVVPGETVTMHDDGDGERIWSADPAAPAYGQPVIADGTVYLGHDAGVEAFALGSGEREWLHRTTGGTTTVAVGDDLVYADVEDGPLLALSAGAGTERWRVGDSDGLTRAPTVDDGTVYVGGRELVAVDAETGATHWRADPPDAASQLGTVAAVGGRVVGVGTVDAGSAVVAAYDAGDGSPLWSNTVAKTPSTADGDPVAVGGEVLAALGGLRAFDAVTGQQRWHGESETTHRATPALAGSVAVMRAGREGLRAVDLSERTELWTLSIGSTLATAPVVGLEGTVYAGDESGTLYAVRGERREEVGPTSTPRTFGYDWADSWAPTAGLLGAAHVAAPLVLGALVGLHERLQDDDED